jgi:hypothetical protein
MGARMKFPLAGLYGREWSIAIGTVVTGASGAIASQTSERDSGFTAVKTATKTGRYTLTFAEPLSDAVLLSATIIGAADAAISNTSGGTGPTFARNLSASTRTIDVQFTRNSDSADTEITSNLSFQLTFLVKAAGT